jgi:hypothetical protein
MAETGAFAASALASVAVHANPRLVRNGDVVGKEQFEQPQGRVGVDEPRP